MKINIPFPDKKYSIIYADPPWDVKAGPAFHTNGKTRNLPYPTMSIDEIENLKINEIAEKNSHLYIWTINKFLGKTYDIVSKWGFKPATLITWCKNPMGMGLGGAFASNSEYLLFCRRGKLKTKRRINRNWFVVKRGKHSVKPEFFRNMIIDVSGDLPKIELFARKRTLNWDVWGNEV